MQKRDYPEDDGHRIWLNRQERQQLLDTTHEDPRRELAFTLGLHGLRSEEIVRITKADVVDLPNDNPALRVQTGGKSGERQLPISDNLRQQIHYLSNAAQLRQQDPLVDVSTRSVRSWITDAKDELVNDNDDWGYLSSHDLRRTWATDTFYSLALNDVPIAEDLVLAWGGWANSKTGRDTFRESYLGPVPDHVTSDVADDLHLP